MAACAFPFALGMSNIGFALFCPLRTPPDHARVDLPSSFGVANPETFSREAGHSCARRHGFYPCNDCSCPPPATITPQSLPARHLLPFFSRHLRRCPSTNPLPPPQVDCLVPSPPTPASLSPSHSRPLCRLARVLSLPSLASCLCSCVASHLVSSRCIPSPISSPHIALSLIVASSSLPIAPRLVVVFIVVIASLTSRHVALSPLVFLSLRCVSLSRRVVILARLVVAVLRIVSS